MLTFSDIRGSPSCELVDTPSLPILDHVRDGVDHLSYVRSSASIARVMTDRHVGLLERDAAAVCIAAAVERASTGRGGVVLVSGPPGIGKTSVLRAAVAQLAGMTVLRATCGDLERDQRN